MVVPLQRDKIPIPVLCSENLFLTNVLLWLAKNSSQDSFRENSCQLKEFWFISQTADRNWAGNSLEWVVRNNPQTFPMIWTVSVCTQPLIFSLWLHEWLHSCNRDKLGLLAQVPVNCSFSPTKNSKIGSHRQSNRSIAIYTSIFPPAAASFLIGYRRGMLMQHKREKF